MVGSLQVSSVCLVSIILFSFPGWVISTDLFLLWASNSVFPDLLWSSCNEKHGSVFTPFNSQAYAVLQFLPFSRESLVGEVPLSHLIRHGFLCRMQPVCGRIVLPTPGGPVACYGEEPGLEFVLILLLPPSAGIGCVNCHAWLLGLVLMTGKVFN